MPVIEERLAAGVAQRDIVAVLQEGGIAVRLATFKSYLHRDRARQRKEPSGPRQVDPDPPRSEQGHFGKVCGPNPAPTSAVATDAETADRTNEPIGARMTLAEWIDPRNRDILTDKYMTQKPSLIGRRRD
ncbi:hypothetical protein ACBY01_11810 [Sphingomonas sp. ac-8]|uniref:hypothetical protein n=1 Tax=Sphingomonas sp. ac-8 TaxID=3242977 RepID=UPI003A7F8F8D